MAKSVILASCLAILLAVFAVSNLRDRINTDAVILVPAKHAETMQITEHEHYVQTNGTFNRIRLYFYSYDRANKLSTTIHLTDYEIGNVLESWEIDNSSVGNEEVELKLNKKLSKGTYRLVFEGHNSNPETSIGIYL